MTPSNQADANTEPPPFRAIADLIHAHAVARPGHPALLRDDERVTYGELDALMDRVAASLQRDGLAPGDAIALCAWPSPRYAILYLGALRAGVAVAPLAPSVTPESFASMLADAGARLLFVDAAADDALDGNPWTASTGCRSTARRSTRGSCPQAPARRLSRCGPSGRSTSSIRPARPGSRRASCNRMRCAGPT